MNELKKIVQDMRRTDWGLGAVQYWAGRLEALSQTHVLVPREPSDELLLSCVHPQRRITKDPLVLARINLLREDYKTILRAAEGEE